jgi:predicted amidohydrolase YtcJ
VKQQLRTRLLVFAVLLVIVQPTDSRRLSFPSFQKADLLLLNAHVITMDPTRPNAQAIAIQGDRIAWVGNNEDARRLFAETARVIDLHGATVLPGLNDAHVHLLELGKSLVRLNLKDVRDETEAVALVKQRVASAAANEWILGWGWDEGKWASHYPTNQALSEISPNNPVYLVGLHSFAAWANKQALQIAGVTKDTKDPENGKVLRDGKTGEPTGILLNRAQALVEKHIPPMTLEQTKKAIELAAGECVHNGLTSVHDARVSPIMLQAFRELIREGRMPLRVYAILDGADHALVDEWLKRGPEIDPQHRLTIRSFKLFADGALGSRGASLLQPYSDAPQTKGVITTPEKDVYELTHRSLLSGFQVCTHAIGDAANRMVLDAYTRALDELPASRNLGPGSLHIRPRLRIEHAQVLAPADIPRFAQLGVIPSMQPTHCTSDMPWAEKRVGPERIKGAYAWRSLLATGVHLPLSSDFPGETLNPFYGIYAAITRQDPNGNPAGGWYRDERMTLPEALRGYTVEAAYAEFEEKAKGSIESGKLADFAVVSQDITKLAPKEILSLQVLKTFVGGKLVYNAEKDSSQGVSVLSRALENPIRDCL